MWLAYLAVFLLSSNNLSFISFQKHHQIAAGIVFQMLYEDLYIPFLCHRSKNCRIVLVIYQLMSEMLIINCQILEVNLHWKKKMVVIRNFSCIRSTSCGAAYPFFVGLHHCMIIFEHQPREAFDLEQTCHFRMVFLVHSVKLNL